VLDDATAESAVRQRPLHPAAQAAVRAVPPGQAQGPDDGRVYLENTLVSGAFTQSAARCLDDPGVADRVSLENAATVRGAARQGRGDLARQRRAASEIAVASHAERELRSTDTARGAESPRTLELTQANQKLRVAAAERERIEAELRSPRSSSRSAGSPRDRARDQHAGSSTCPTASVMRDRAAQPDRTIGKYPRAGNAIDRRAMSRRRQRRRVRSSARPTSTTRCPTRRGARRCAGRLGRVTAIVRSMKDFAHRDPRGEEPG